MPTTINGLIPRPDLAGHPDREPGGGERIREKGRGVFSCRVSPPILKKNGTPVTQYARQFSGKERAYICAPNANAYRAIGTVQPGFRMELVNRGQFSAIDVVRVLLEHTGPAALTVSTWTIGRAEAFALCSMLDDGLISDLLLMMNRAFKTMHRQWSQNPAAIPPHVQLERVFGADRILQCKSHAKFILIVNETWKIAIRTSANFNRNIRLEQFSIDDDPEMVRFYSAIVESWGRVVPRGFSTPSSAVDRVFDHGRPFSDVRALPDPVDGEFDVPDIDLGNFEDLDLSGLDLGVD